MCKPLRRGYDAGVRPLFERFPALRERVRFEALAELPSPVVEHRGVLVKRDDLIGGTKVRKLEFFHPEGALLAFGSEGSNWLRALSERRRDVRILSWPQRHNAESRANVPRIGGRRFRDVVHFGLAALAELPRILGGLSLAPIGGSDPVTTLGLVNGALELAGQVARGESPAPDAVFVPLGTCGTAAGLALGFALAGLDVTLHAVRITGRLWANRRNVEGLASQSACLLGELPRLCRLELEGGFVGEGYGAPTPVGREAQAFFDPLPVDTSYASKAAACLLARRSRYRRPLLWLTSSRP